MRPSKKTPRSRAAATAHEAGNALAKIYVRACQLSGAHLVGKSEFLAKLEEYVLLLQPRDATKEDVAAMCRFLQHRKTPELLDAVVITRGNRSAKAQFDANTTGIHPRILDKLCQCLAKSTSLRTLVVHDFPGLPIALLKKLVPKITTCASLTAVCLRKIPLADAGLLEIAPHLENSVIRLLILQDCGLTDESILTLQKLLKCHAAKRDVHIWDSTLRDYPLTAQEREASNLRATQLSAIHGILALDLSNNEFTDTAAVALSSYLANDPWICGVNLARNKIGATGLAELIDVALRNENLSALGLSGNPGRREMDDMTYTELCEDLDIISRRSIGGLQRIEALMPSDVKRVLLQWKANDETLKCKPQKHARRQSPAPSMRRPHTATTTRSASSQDKMTAANSRARQSPTRIAWGLAEQNGNSGASDYPSYMYTQSSNKSLENYTGRFIPSPSPRFTSDEYHHSSAVPVSTTLTDQSVQTNDSDEIAISPSRLTDGRPPSRLSVRPRAGRYGSPTGMHSPLLALDEDEFGSQAAAAASRTGWSDLRDFNDVSEPVPSKLDGAWDNTDQIDGFDITSYVPRHSFQEQLRREFSPHGHTNGHDVTSGHHQTNDFGDQPIHPPHQDWQHSSTLQDMRNTYSIEKLSQEVGRLSFQLTELMGQFQSLRSSVTLTGSALPAQATSPARLYTAAAEDTAVTHDLNDQLLCSHVQERLAEKLKQLLLSDEQT